MTGSRRLTLVLVLLTLTALPSCSGSGNGGTAIDRIQPDAAAHAQALAGSDVALMRETGLTLLARLGAFANWSD